MAMAKRKPKTEIAYALNALGRTEIDGAWTPFHLDADGVHRDPHGMRIMPFHEAKRATDDEIERWFIDHGAVPLKFPVHVATVGRA